jgi:hypothetical protein
MIRTITATEYVTPLREGGSLPAIVEGDDDGTYVLKFRGAGQGPKALIAELVSGEIARALELPVPEIVFAQLDPRMARTEPDPEIQELLQKSEGLNLALDYLPGSITFDPLVTRPIEGKSRLASSIVWFDALGDERRSHGEEHEPAGLASQSLDDRPWSDTDFSSRLERPLPRAQPQAVQADQESRPAALGDRDIGVG